MINRIIWWMIKGTIDKAWDAAFLSRGINPYDDSYTIKHHSDEYMQELREQAESEFDAKWGQHFDELINRYDELLNRCDTLLEEINSYENNER